MASKYGEYSELAEERAWPPETFLLNSITSVDLWGTIQVTCRGTTVSNLDSQATLGYVASSILTRYLVILESVYS